MTILSINLYFWVPMGILIIAFVFAFFKRYKMIKGMTGGPDSDNLKILTDANFKVVTGKGISLVDFWAPWCTPCKIQGPIVSQVADEIGDKVNVCKLDVDKNKRVAGSLKIRSIPTIIIFKDGKAVKQFVGVKTKNILLKALNELI
jgi:thioredoxin 1